MIHKACMPVYMNSGKIVAGRVDGWRIEGSTRGPRGPKKACTQTFASQGANGVNVAIVTSG